jgi:hypothetical protein
MKTYAFTFGFRLYCDDYADQGDLALAGVDTVAAMSAVKAALVPMFNHHQAVPLDYDRDFGPHLLVTLQFGGFSDCSKPVETPTRDSDADWFATVASDDLAVLMLARQHAHDEWDEDGDIDEDYPITVVAEG